MMQASKANESVSECSKTGLCKKLKAYGCCHEEIHASHLNRGPIFKFTNLNRNLTQFRPSEIHCQLDPTERNGSLRHVAT